MAGPPPVQPQSPSDARGMADHQDDEEESGPPCVNFFEASPRGAPPSPPPASSPQRSRKFSLGISLRRPSDASAAAAAAEPGPQISFGPRGLKGTDSQHRDGKRPRVRKLPIRNPFKRWNIFAYANAFVMEPNLAMFESSWFRWHKRVAAGDVPEVDKNVPQLIMYRFTDAIIECESGGDNHVRRTFGNLQHCMYADAFFGILRIEKHKFLVLASESDLVGTLPYAKDLDNSNASPNLDAPSPHQTKDTAESASGGGRMAGSWDADCGATFNIAKASLIPFTFQFGHRSRPREKARRKLEHPSGPSGPGGLQNLSRSSPQLSRMQDSGGDIITKELLPADSSNQADAVGGVRPHKKSISAGSSFVGGLSPPRGAIPPPRGGADVSSVQFEDPSLVSSTKSWFTQQLQNLQKSTAGGVLGDTVSGGVQQARNVLGLEGGTGRGSGSPTESGATKGGGTVEGAEPADLLDMTDDLSGSSDNGDDDDDNDSDDDDDGEEDHDDEDEEDFDGESCASESGASPWSSDERSDGEVEKRRARGRAREVRGDGPPERRAASQRPATVHRDVSDPDLGVRSKLSEAAADGGRGAADARPEGPSRVTCSENPDVAQGKQVPFTFANGASFEASGLNWGTIAALKMVKCVGEKVNHYRIGLEKMLTTGFYYSYEIDITNSLQRKHLTSVVDGLQGVPARPLSTPTDPKDHPNPSEPGANVSLLDSADSRFTWNIEMIKPLVAWGVDPRWVLPLMQGSINTASILTQHHLIDLTLVCRRSPLHAGTRYNARGIDSSANVANFCESELLIHCTRKRPKGIRAEIGPGEGWASLVQIRGSVPLFWEQSGIGVQPKPSLKRSKKDTIPVFRVYQDQLHKFYGDILYVNLLADCKGGESRLTSALMEQLMAYLEHRRKQNLEEGTREASQQGLRHVQWDFHAEVKNNGFEDALQEVTVSLVEDAYRCGYFCERPLWTTGATVQFQRGTVRTNCLDCLDRTNAFQWYFAWTWASQYLADRGVSAALFRPATKLPGRSWQSDISTLPAGSTATPSTENYQGRRGVDVTDSNASTLALPGGAPLYTVSSDVTGAWPRINTPGGGADFPIGLSSRRSEDSLRAVYVAPNGAISIADYLAVGNSGEEGGATGDYASVVKDIIAQMWADHGDNISVQYTGTRSVFSALVKQAGKPSFATNMDHLFRSIGRLYQNNFEDTQRQELIELLIGAHRICQLPFSPPSGPATSPSGIPPTAPPLPPSAVSVATVSPSRSNVDKGSAPSSSRSQKFEPFKVPDTSGKQRRIRRHKDVNSVATTESPRGIDIILGGEAARPRVSSCVVPATDPHAIDVRRLNSARSEKSEASKATVGSVSTAATATVAPATAASSAASTARTRKSGKGPADAAETFTAGEIGHGKIWIGTWNLAGKSVYESLEKWIRPTMPDGSASAACDLYVICVQELVELSGMRVLLNTGDKDREWQLEHNVCRVLGDSYVRMKSASLVGLFIVIYAKASIRNLVSDMDICDVRLGFKGMGNKGAVGVCMRFGKTSLCFLNVHLAPGPGSTKQEERRAQFNGVLDQAFQNSKICIPVMAYDIVFAAGDFNVRLDCDMAIADSLLSMKENGELVRRYDQMLRDRKWKIAPFNGWQESEINFRPTYKYRKGSMKFERSRVPAWCDRVIWSGTFSKSRHASHLVKCLRYDCCCTLMSSDHKPTFALFEFRYRTSKSAKRRAGGSGSIVTPPAAVSLMHHRRMRGTAGLSSSGGLSSRSYPSTFATHRTTVSDRSSGHHTKRGNLQSSESSSSRPVTDAPWVAASSPEVQELSAEPALSAEKVKADEQLLSDASSSSTESSSSSSCTSSSSSSEESGGEPSDASSDDEDEKEESSSGQATVSVATSARGEPNLLDIGTPPSEAQKSSSTTSVSHGAASKLILAGKGRAAGDHPGSYGRASAGATGNGRLAPASVSSVGIKISSTAAVPPLAITRATSSSEKALVSSSSSSAAAKQQASLEFLDDFWHKEAQPHQPAIKSGAVPASSPSAMAGLTGTMGETIGSSKPSVGASSPVGDGSEMDFSSSGGVAERVAESLAGGGDGAKKVAAAKKPSTRRKTPPGSGRGPVTNLLDLN